MAEKKKPTMTVREFLHALNAEERDVDVQVDGTECYIAVCGGDIKFTKEGMEHFGQALDLEMQGLCIMGTDEDYDEYEEDETGRIALAEELLYSLAGYCSCDMYDAWFEGDDAELI